MEINAKQFESKFRKDFCRTCRRLTWFHGELCYDPDHKHSAVLDIIGGLLKTQRNIIKTLFILALAIIFLAASLMFHKFAHAEVESQRGLASWYTSSSARNTYTASNHSIKKLEASGVHFAAMWGVKLGKKYRVTNLKNKRSVIVRILDRGPNKRFKRRIIDLSRHSFKQIADPKAGLIPVSVEPL